MSLNRQIFFRQDGRVDASRTVAVAQGDWVMTVDEDAVIQELDGHVVSLPPNPGNGIVCTVYFNSVTGTVSGNGALINGVASVALTSDQAVECVWDSVLGEWQGSVMTAANSGGSPILVSPITQGLVEYDELNNPAAPFTKTFTDEFGVHTVDATVTTIVTPDPLHAALFDVNGIVLDDNTVTRFDAEVSGQDNAGNAGEWKYSMSWIRAAGGAPVALRAAVLLSDTDGTNGPGAPPAGWGTPTITASALIGGKYYAVPTVTGKAATAIDWGMLIQWRKTA